VYPPGACGPLSFFFSSIESSLWGRRALSSLIPRWIFFSFLRLFVHPVLFSVGTSYAAWSQRIRARRASFSAVCGSIFKASVFRGASSSANSPFSEFFPLTFFPLQTRRTLPPSSLARRLRIQPALILSYVSPIFQASQFPSSSCVTLQIMSPTLSGALFDSPSIFHALSRSPPPRELGEAWMA